MSGLRRSLGAAALSLYGLGAILGAGIYSVIGAAAGTAGPGLWMSFVIGGVVALLTALSYAELATLFPEAGGEVVYLRRALPTQPWLAFTAGAMVALSCAATIATVAIAFGGYLAELVELPPMLTAAVLLIALTAIGLWGIRESTGVTALFTLIEAAGLGLVVWAGTREGGLGDALATAPSFELLAGASIVFFSFLGFENIVNLAAETKDPARALPRAIIFSVCAATLLYTLVALAIVTLAEPEALADSKAPLTEAVRRVAPGLSSVLSGVALFATANTALASIMSGSRVLYGMAEERQLPRVVGAVLKRRKTPWVATLLLSTSAAALLPLGEIRAVASVSSFAALIAFILVNGALIVLRRSKPDLKRPFRVPGSLGGIPVLPVMGALVAALLLLRLPYEALVIGAAALAVLVAGRLAFAVRARL
jgi:APA family basic amino acid/polyamine antiporter